MDITLNDSEIKTAINKYLASSGIEVRGKTVEITLVNGRKGRGSKAFVSISDESEMFHEPKTSPQPTDSSFSDDDDVTETSDQSLFGSGE